MAKLLCRAIEALEICMQDGLMTIQGATGMNAVLEYQVLYIGGIT